MNTAWKEAQEFRSCRVWGCEIVVGIPQNFCLHVWNRITFVDHASPQHNFFAMMEYSWWSFSMQKVSKNVEFDLFDIDLILNEMSRNEVDLVYLN